MDEDGFDSGDSFDKQRKKVSHYVYIETKDGFKCPANIRALTTCSLYFRYMFSCWNKVPKKLLRLSEVTAVGLIYCMNIAEIVEKGVLSTNFNLNYGLITQHIFPAAVFLWMETVLDALGTIMKLWTKPNELLYFFQLTNQYCPKLAPDIWDVVLNRFMDIVWTNSYLLLSDNDFADAFLDERLNIEPEFEWAVVNTYQKYHRYCPKAHALRNSMEVGSSDCMVVKERLPQNIVCSIGGWTEMGPSSVVETLAKRRSNWVDSERAGIEQDRAVAYHSTCVVDDKLYVCGGMDGIDRFSSVRVLDFETAKWSDAPSMTDCRCFASSISIRDAYSLPRIIVAGGFNGISRLNTAEMFDVVKSEWIPITSMLSIRSDAGIAVVGGIPVVVGGFDGMRVYNTAEYYDPCTGQWYSISRRMGDRRTGLGAIALDNNVFMAVGGFDGNFRLKSAEIYDFREGIWHETAKMNVFRSNFGIELFGGQAIVAGGFSLNRTTEYVECYDARLNEWISMPALSEPRSAIKLFSVQNRSFIRKAIQFGD